MLILKNPITTRVELEIISEGKAGGSIENVLPQEKCGYETGIQKISAKGAGLTWQKLNRKHINL